MLNMIGIPSFKIVAVGDGAIGKTCLLVTYAKNRFPEEYIPTVFENYDDQRQYKNFDNNIVRLSIWDTAGQEDLANLRRCSYPETQLLLICFDIMSPTSLENVLVYWKEELDEHCPDALRILVGTKFDLRTDPLALKKMKEIDNTDKPVPTEEAERVAKEIGCLTYVETSAKNRHNINELFACATDYCLKKYWKPIPDVLGGGGLSGGLSGNKKKKKKKTKSGKIVEKGFDFVQFEKKKYEK